MATPQEEMGGNLKDQLARAHKATGKSLEKLWAMYNHVDGRMGFRTFQKWFSPREDTTPDLFEYDILAGLLNELQKEVKFPRPFGTSMRYFPPEYLDLHVLAPPVRLLRPEHQIRAREQIG